MSQNVQYMIRDGQGNEYGPADIPMLRQWILERRILGTMQIAPTGTSDWASVSAHPQLADLFAAAGAPAPTPASAPQQPPNPYAAAAAPTPTAYPSGASGYSSAPQQGYPGSSPLPYAGGQPKTNGMAIASLCCGIAGCCCVPGILGVIFGFIARKQIKESNGQQTGDGLALAGIIVGAVFCVLWVVRLLYVMAVAVNAAMQARGR